MSLDLTGIVNANGFFSDYYLATLFEEAVADASSQADAEEKQGGPRAPYKALESTRQAFFRTAAAFARSSQEAARRQQVEMAADSLMQALGYGEAAPVDVPTDDGAAVPVWREYLDDAGQPQVQALIVVGPAGEDLFEGAVSADWGLEEAVGALFFKVSRPARFVLAVGIDQVALFDREKWGEKRYLAFDLRTVHERRERTTYRALAALLSRASLAPKSAESLLDAMERRSRSNAQGVSDQLKYALRECVELLGNEVVFDWTHNLGRAVEELDAGELTIECLRYMYRLLFLLFMEARPELGFAPMQSEPYASAYSLESLREVADDVRGAVGLDAETDFLARTLERLCNMVYYGYPSDAAAYRKLLGAESTKGVFAIPPLKAHIFDAQRTPLISAARLRDGVMLKIVDLMSVAPAHGNARAGRISYNTLGINQLGAVYEALLSYRGFIATEDLYEVKKAGERFDELEVGYFVTEPELSGYDEDERVRDEAGELRVHHQGTFVYRLAGRERERSASYYTPESLTHCLVKYALKELLRDKTADEVLQLTVLEPAMGSAAFLNEAVSQLADAYLERKQQELGREIPREERALELQRVKTYIADRNVFGVDLNPIAVELGEVSLWLNTVSADGYVPWFGNQLFCGNSLVGARRRGFAESQLTSRAAGVRWYDNEPARIGWGRKSGQDHRVYHFLAFDPDMAAYDDRVAKTLEPAGFEAAKKWRKACQKPYTAQEVEVMRRLSAAVDDLWTKQIRQQRDVRAKTQAATGAVFGQEAQGAGSMLTIRERDALYASAYKSEDAKNAGPYARLRFAMDYWCALWFWPLDRADLLPTRAEFLVDLSLILEGTVDAAAKTVQTAQTSLVFADAPELNAPEQRQLDELAENYGAAGTVDLARLCALSERLALARDVAAKQHFFHWDLEFADTLEARGGFDLVLGNPPWVKLEWKEQDVLADFDPRFALKGWSAAETANRRATALADPAARRAYLDEYVDCTAQKTFLGAAQCYPLVKGQQANLYRNFLPQAWEHLSAAGIAAFVHPDGIWNDTKAAALRAEADARQNNRFDAIFNLYDPQTIEACYMHDGSGPVPGVKDEQGHWNTAGHAARVIRVGERELRTFAALLGDDWESTRVLNVHAQPLMEVLEAMAGQRHTLRDLEKQGLLETSVCWDETHAREDGTLCDRVGFPPTDGEVVYSGPFIGVGDPLYQGARRNYRVNSDYDPIDLTDIGADFRVRTKYARACAREEYERRQPGTPWGEPFCGCYRLANRKMISCSLERTMSAAIVPPGSTWIDAVYGWALAPKATEKVKVKAVENSGGLLALMAGCCSTVVYDYFVRSTGKHNLRGDTVLCFPPESPVNPEIRCRALLLNCLTESYAPLWRECWDEAFRGMAWSREDPRLDPARFSALDGEWGWDTPLRSDYERRQALVELDVLAALALGLSLDQLLAVCELDFSVLQSYEADTWYDQRGRIVFTPKKGAALYQLSREDWQAVAGKRSGTVRREFDDDTQPGGPRRRTVCFEAPFTRCDRAADYRAAWAFFARRYGLEGGRA